MVSMSEKNADLRPVNYLIICRPRITRQIRQRRSAAGEPAVKWRKGVHHGETENTERNEGAGATRETICFTPGERPA